MSGVGTIGSAIAVGFSFPIIDGIFVALRFYTRWQLKAERQLDDWLCIPAWVRRFPLVRGPVGRGITLTSLNNEALLDRMLRFASDR